MNEIYVIDIIQKVVQDITPDVLPIIQQRETDALNIPSLIQTINFQPGGSVDELIQTLAQDDKSESMKMLKYPLVWLVQDFPETQGMQPGFYAETTLNIVIAHQTTATYKITDRYKYVFKPVLYPIYGALMEGLAASDMINQNDPQIIQRVKWDRAYWGRKTVGGNDGNKLNDYVDAIDITNLKLTILNNNC